MVVVSDDKQAREHLELPFCQDKNIRERLHLPSSHMKKILMFQEHLL